MDFLLTFYCLWVAPMDAYQNASALSCMWLWLQAVHSSLMYRSEINVYIDLQLWILCNFVDILWILTWYNIWWKKLNTDLETILLLPLWANTHKIWVFLFLNPRWDQETSKWSHDPPWVQDNIQYVILLHNNSFMAWCCKTIKNLHILDTLDYIQGLETQ